MRRPGEDMLAGTAVLQPGSRLGGPELAVCASAGRAALRCTRRPRVALVSTGDELRSPGEPLTHGQVHDSNRIALTALAIDAGAAVHCSRHAADDAEETRPVLGEALEGTDLLLVCGGVSVGPHDHVKGALQALGFVERFWGVALRPGKPTWFGTREATLAGGLPGNPVSAIVTFLLLFRPALAALQGTPPPPPLTARLAGPVRRNSRRTEAVRVALDTDAAGTLQATPGGVHGSHVSTSLLGADGLALIEPGDGEAAAGERVTVVRIR
ncbi:MAG: hypothetical protein NVS1B9_08330 [Solirubrobacteraceae bacterium]